MLQLKCVQRGASMMFWNILDIYSMESYLSIKYWYSSYQIAKCQFHKFWSYKQIWTKLKNHSRQITLALTTVYIGWKFRTNTIWDSTNQISNTVFIGITISLIHIAWTCTWTARPHIITTCTLNKSFLKRIFSNKVLQLNTFCFLQNQL